MRPLIVFFCALAFSSCETQPRIYNEPDPTKVAASTKRLSAAVTKAADTAGKAKAKVAEAQKNSDRIAAKFTAIVEQTSELEKVVPEDLRPQVAELRAAVEEQRLEVGLVSATLFGAHTDQEQLTQDLAEAQAAKQELQANQLQYRADAQEIARNATDERTARIGVEKKLSWYRWHWWGSWIALGAGILACGVFAFLKFTGRLAFTGAQIAAKL